MHKCSCDWCPAYREDLDAQTKGYDRALAQLAEARAENERLRVVVGAREMSRDNYKKMALELAEENERLLAAMGSMHEAEPECAEMGCSVCAALARPTGGPRDE